MARRLRSSFDRRAPEEVTLDYEVETTEKVEVPTLDGSGGVRVEERATGQYEARTLTLHILRNAPGDRMLVVAGADIGDPAQARGVRDMIKSNVVEADTLLALSDDPHVSLGLTDLINVFEQVMEIATDRPTSAPKR